ncbi:MAG: serine/threonine protein kinase, partial [Bradymonadia bacterium]
MYDDALAMRTESPTGPGAARDSTTDSIPARIGPYRVDGLLGRGGVGEVYRAYDEGLQRAIVVKSIAAPHRAHVDARARFWREARALAALDHPGIVRVHRLDESDAGELYLAMELVDGAPLSAALGNAWPSNAVAAVGRQAAQALAAAHRVGLTHRDVKPANLLLQADGVVRVVDFGLARRPSAIEERITATGARVGPPAYMAPEQINGREVGPATDVFALGVVLYRALAGQHPFARGSAEATALAVTATRCAPLQSVTPMADPTLTTVVMRCLAQRPEDRYPDGAALAAALAPIPAMTSAALAAFAIEQAAIKPALSSSARVAP